MVERTRNKINTILDDRYYLENYKSITFEEIKKHTKYKKPNIPSHLRISRLNFDKVNRSFPRTFLLLWEIDFQKNAEWGNE